MKEKIKEMWSELIYHVNTWFVLSFEAFKLRLAILLADIKQKARNRRFFVVLMTVGLTRRGDPVVRLRSIDNEGFKYASEGIWLPKRMSSLELHQNASTPIIVQNKVYGENVQAMRNYKRYQKPLTRKPMIQIFIFVTRMTI